MELQEEWQNMNVELNTATSTAAIASFKFDNQSHSLINDIIFKLKWKLRWTRIISLPMLIAAFFIKSDLQFLLLAIFITYELFRIICLKELNKIRTAIDFNATTKQVLEDNLKSIKRILRIEDVFGYAFLPLSVPIGWLAYQLFVHQNLATVIDLPNIHWQLLLSMVIGIPIIFAVQKMNNSIFKAPIDELKEKINTLSENND